MDREYETGFPKKLIQSIACECKLREYENYRLYQADLINGSSILFAGTSVPDLNKELRSNIDGSVVPTFVSVGSDPFKAQLRLDLVIGCKEVYIEKKLEEEDEDEDSTR